MPLRNDLLNPIPGDNPSGANLRYDPVTEKIKEARREDLDVPQGQWKTAIKTADLKLVIKLSSEVLANRSKDLQIAAWLVDAHVRQEGFVIVAPCLRFLHDLLEQFWDTLYPPIDEDGDMEVRSAPLAGLGGKLGEQFGFLPIVSNKLSWNKYNESRKVGSEAGADSWEKQQARTAAINEGKISAEMFDEAADATPVEKLRETYKQLTESQAALDSLTEYCDEKFGEFSPSFIKTREALEEITQTVRIILGRRPGGLEEPKEEEPEELPEETIEDSSVSMAAPADQAETVSESFESETARAAAPRSRTGGGYGPPTTREEAARQLGAICSYLRSADPSDPAPYMILRAFAWAPLYYAAPAIRTDRVQAPSSELRLTLKRLSAEGETDKVLEVTENALLETYGATWLDMQRYAVQAIERTGYPDVARVLNTQLRFLLETIPDYPDLTLPDDSPTANAETKSWLDTYVVLHRPPPSRPPEESAGSGDSTGSTESTESTEPSETSFDSLTTEETPAADTSFEAAPEPEPAPPEPEPYTVEESPPILEAEQPPPSDLSDEFAQALAAVKEGRTADGLAVITNILATERSGRARFRRRTQLAHLLMAAGKGKVAQPLLDQLAAEIEERRLEDWEQSETIAYPLELLLHCLSPADEERRAQLYTRICKLDPVRALNCSF